MVQKTTEVFHSPSEPFQNVGSPPTDSISRRFLIIVIQQPAQPLITTNLTNWQLLLRLIQVNRQVVQALMGPMLIVKFGIGLDDVIEMTQAETNEVV